MQKVRGAAGYSIIELMVTVAIIGVLAAIAVPNYQRMQSKSRQKEAQLNLRALSKSMKAFWSEHVVYTTQFETIGFNPEGALYYIYGFKNNVAPPATAIPPGNAQCYRTIRPSGALPNCGTAAYPFTKKWTITSSASAVVFNPIVAPYTPTNASWTAAAAGQINGTGNDTWIIDDTDTLTNINPQL